MAKSQQSWNKKEREKKKQKEKQDKADRKQERKASGGGSKSLEDMMAYVDAEGNIVDSPPDPSQRREIALEDIVIGVPKPRESDEDNLRTGIISFFNEGKGFGFIRDLRTGESIFVHASQAEMALKEQMKVSFATERGPRGITAVQVKPA